MEMSANPMLAANVTKGSLVIPAREDMLLVIRLTLSGIASATGFDVDEIDDIRDAVTEAAHMLIRKLSPDDELRVAFNAARNGLEIVLTGGADVGFSQEMDDVCLCILHSLVDTAEILQKGVRLLKRKA